MHMDHRIILWLLPGFLLLPFSSYSQEKTWTLQDCLDYAMENNVSLQRSRNAYLSGLEDTEQARAALFPSLSASSSQGVSAAPSSQSTGYNGSYGLNADMTLYSGGKLRRAVKAQEVQNQRDSLSWEENALDIRIAIVQAVPICGRIGHRQRKHSGGVPRPA